MSLIVLRSPILGDYLERIGRGNWEVSLARHIVGNAIDAHTEAGLRKEEIEIEQEGEYIVVRDKGRGICPETMEQAFRQVTYTTRDDLKKYIGRMGFGLKAILAHVSEYRIRTVYGGRVYNYTVKRAGGGEIICKVEEGEGGGIGTEVRVRVRCRDGAQRLRWRLSFGGVRDGIERWYEGEDGYAWLGNTSEYGIEVETDKGLIYPTTWRPSIIGFYGHLVLRIAHHALEYGIGQDQVVDTKRNRIVLKSYKDRLEKRLLEEEREVIDRAGSVYDAYRERRIFYGVGTRLKWRGKEYSPEVALPSKGKGIVVLEDGRTTETSRIDMNRYALPIRIGERIEGVGYYLISRELWERLNEYKRETLQPYVEYEEPKKERKKRDGKKYFYGQGIRDSRKRPYPRDVEEERLYTVNKRVWEVYRALGVECVLTSELIGGNWVSGEIEIRKYLSEEEERRILKYLAIETVMEEYYYSFRDLMERRIPVVRIAQYELKRRRELAEAIKKWRQPDLTAVFREEYPHYADALDRMSIGDIDYDSTWDRYEYKDPRQLSLW